jgi:hypothetical protein
LELQIRTKLQHNWATAVETAGTFTSTSLKSSKGSDEWLNFFKIVSSLFAMEEKLPVIEIHSTKTEQYLIKNYHKLSEKLRVIDMLRAFRVTSKQIEQDKFPGDYYLIFIDIQNKHVNITTYKKKLIDSATKKYLELEKIVKETENAVVLVSANSIKFLKKAYPSYFLDTSDFILVLQRFNTKFNELNLI